MGDFSAFQNCIWSNQKFLSLIAIILQIFPLGRCCILLPSDQKSLWPNSQLPDILKPSAINILTCSRQAGDAVYAHASGLAVPTHC